jgi:hypothetical protein
MMRDGEERPLQPMYLRGVLTVEAELSDGHLHDGYMHTGNVSRVLVALSFVGGVASLVTEDESGQLTRLRIPGCAFLRLTDDAAGKLARSRQQSEELRDDGGRTSEAALARPAGRDRHRGHQPTQHG